MRRAGFSRWYLTDRYAVDLYTRLFIPKPWVGPSVVY